VRERNGTKIFDDALMSADDAFLFGGTIVQMSALMMVVLVERFK